MVIRPPYIYDTVKPTLKFFIMVGDIRGKIGSKPVVSDHHPVLFIPEFFRAKPKSPILFINQVFFFKIINGCLDPPRIV